jgi:hypothetical protein
MYSYFILLGTSVTTCDTGECGSRRKLCEGGNKGIVRRKMKILKEN